MNLTINGRELAVDRVAEALVGEEVRIGPCDGNIPESITVTSVPSGAAPQINGRELTGFSVPGLYQFDVSCTNEQARSVQVFVFEHSVVDWLPSMPSSGSSTPHDKRLILRAIAQHAERADGTVKGITTRGMNPRTFGA